MAEAKVDDLEHGARVEAEVLGLDVAVADLLAVAVRDAVEQLVEVGARDDVVHAVAQGGREEQRDQVAARRELLHDGDGGAALRVRGVADLRVAALAAAAVVVRVELEAAAVLVVAPAARAAAVGDHAVVADHVDVAQLGQRVDLVPHLAQGRAGQLAWVHHLHGAVLARGQRADADLAERAHAQRLAHPQALQQQRRLLALQPLVHFICVHGGSGRAAVLGYARPAVGGALLPSALSPSAF